MTDYEEKFFVLIHIANHENLHPVGELTFMLKGDEVRWFNSAKEARTAAREHEAAHRNLVRCYVTAKSWL